MSDKIHLLGGSGRIGRALVDSLIAQPLDNISSIQIYCDSTKVSHLQSYYSKSTSPWVKASGYSAFNKLSMSSHSYSEVLDANRHIVLNLRGINNKQHWLNQPLDALELHARSCNAVVDANLWMQPGSEIIHLSSLLCDLIEGPKSLEEIKFELKELNNKTGNIVNNCTLPSVEDGTYEEFDDDDDDDNQSNETDDNSVEIADN